ncbi:MAG: hypothetical protein MNSN_01800 [Minisyncoccus archaeiphilus]|uniref:hypothetical protein n=1 Tax=Minisyncoccus archaeiphilus TaxID=3238481 RepID=UPI002B153525|nr:MAG: hypothetical protein MNSN_01800 [Candidatus Parcubacteria bacterium]
MRKKKRISGIIVFAFAIVGVINTVGYILSNVDVCTGRFEGDPEAVCYSLVANK